MKIHWSSSVAFHVMRATGPIAQIDGPRSETEHDMSTCVAQRGMRVPLHRAAPNEWCGP